MASEVVPISASLIPKPQTDYTKYGYDFPGDGSFVVMPGMGILAVSFLARALKRQAREAVGKRFRESDDDGLEMRVTARLVGRLDGDGAVALDYRATAIELDCPPDKLREAVDWLARIRAIAIEASGAGEGTLVWVNPSIAHSPGVDPYRAAKRHRFPRLDLDPTPMPAAPLVEEFEDIVWQVAQLCSAELEGSGRCDWDLGFGLCQQHATDADRAHEEAERRRAEQRACEEWRERVRQRRNELAARRQTPCPVCRAQPGEHCRTASGGRAREPHTSRRSGAADMGRQNLGRGLLIR
ncbi:hypothetical protein ACIRPT_39975 [Streptomyces sp. NPDC101227]|uniref:hypothetical protein n=1 Tax=Streptomyces sp. NPDC101227 TaxID=3366136 RepID=UPI00380CD630